MGKRYFVPSKTILRMSSQRARRSSLAVPLESAVREVWIKKAFTKLSSTQLRDALFHMAWRRSPAAMREPVPATGMKISLGERNHLNWLGS
jgi:hypothetical protein